MVLAFLPVYMYMYIIMGGMENISAELETECMMRALLVGIVGLFLLHVVQVTRAIPVSGLDI